MGTLMQGLHAFEPTTKTVIDLESFVPDDHLLRDVDRLLEPALIRQLTAPSGAGQLHHLNTTSLRLLATTRCTSLSISSKP